MVPDHWHDDSRQQHHQCYGYIWPNMIPDMTDYDSLRFTCSLYAVSR
jgi:hypothetical protein